MMRRQLQLHRRGSERRPRSLLPLRFLFLPAFRFSLRASSTADRMRLQRVQLAEEASSQHFHARKLAGYARRRRKTSRKIDDDACHSWIFIFERNSRFLFVARATRFAIRKRDT